MKIFNLVLFSSLLFKLCLSQAIDFKPYSYHNQKTALREDIAPIYNKLQIKISPEHLSSMTEIQLNNKNIFLFKEVAMFYEIAAAPDEKIWQKLNPLQSCTQNLMEPNLSQLKQKLPPETSSFIEKALFSCQLVYQPELFNRDLKPGEVQSRDFKNLAGLIKILIDPLSNIPFAANLASPELLTKMRLVFTKILYSHHQKNLKISLQQLEKIHFSILNAADLNPSEKKILIHEIYLLKNELLKAQNFLENLNQEGLKQAALDRNKVISSGRLRDELPFPNLTDEERKFTTFWLSNLYWRLRGGGVVTRSDSTQWRRIHYTLKAMSLIAELNGGARVKNQGYLIFLGLFKKYSIYFDMGRNTNQFGDEDYDMAKMTERGIFLVKKAADSLKSKGFDDIPLRLAGLQMGGCYLFAYDKKMNKSRIDYTGPQAGQIPQKNSPYLGFLEYEIDWGENCIGAAIGVALSDSLLRGYLPQYLNENNDF